MTDTGNSTMTPYDFIYFVANDLSPHTPVIEVSFDVDIRYSFGTFVIRHIHIRRGLSK